MPKAECKEQVNAFQGFKTRMLSEAISTRFRFSSSCSRIMFFFISSYSIKFFKIVEGYFIEYLWRWVLKSFQSLFKIY